MDHGQAHRHPVQSWVCKIALRKADLALTWNESGRVYCVPRLLLSFIWNVSDHSEWNVVGCVKHEAGAPSSTSTVVKVSIFGITVKFKFLTSFPPPLS